MNPSPDKILLIIERDSYEKDAVFIKELVESLGPTGYRPVWYNPHGVGSSQLIPSNKIINALPKALRLLIKIINLFRYPKRLKYYFTTSAWREGTIKGRARNLELFMRCLPENAHVAVFSRSAGGRIASLVADSLGIKKLICLGYPFKHPEKLVEPERFMHLASLKTPFLIIQGTRDEYGGAGLDDIYDLSSSISIEFIDTDHDFKISPEQFNTVVGRIQKFLV